MSRPIVLNNGINTAVSFDLKVINIRAARDGVVGGLRSFCNRKASVNQGKYANKLQRFHCQFVCNLGVTHADEDPSVRIREGKRHHCVCLEHNQPYKNNRMPRIGKQ